MADILNAVAALSLLIWFYLVVFRGGFWRAEARLGDDAPAPARWPEIVALVPARDEAEVIGRSLASLLAQDYPGRFHVVLADDHSGDGTAELARQAAREARAFGREESLTIVAVRDLPPGWSGKLWALHEGLSKADEAAPEADYVWLSDADIEHEPGNLRRLVAKAEHERRDLVSLMVALSCHGWWERLLIPPFIFFFQMLYPFPWVNDPRRRTAAAAGGCILLRRAALVEAGGFAAIRGELIDDCALARRIKDLSRARGTGGIWLGLATTARSIRPYRGLRDIWTMVARSAYTQLHHSPVLLVGTVAGMALTFLAPPLIGLSAPAHGANVAAILGFTAWSAMTLSAWPTYSHYRQSFRLAVLLPLAAALYCAMTLDSARRHRHGRGGTWKGRVHTKAREVEQKPLEE